MLEDRIRSQLINHPGALCAAVSGGQDSMALLHLLLRLQGELGFPLSCVHVEHGIRGENARKDADFVRGYCEEHKIPFRLFRVDAPALARREGLSLEDAARRLRYSCFEELVDSGFCDFVLTAHHQGDQAESILLHLLRGSGLPGLEGMRPQRGFFLRPFLDLSRAEISDYVRAHQIPYVTDESNLNPNFSRNFLRLEIFPLLEARFPGCTARIAGLGDRAGETVRLLESQASAFVSVLENAATVRLDTPAPLFPFAIRLAAARLGIHADLGQVHFDALREFALSGQNGKTLHLPHGLIARREYDCLRLDFGQSSPPREIAFALGQLPFGNCVIQVTAVPERGTDGLFVDADAIPEKAVFRSPQPGDRFCRYGGLTKKLGDYLTDRKIPLRERPALPVLAVGAQVLCVLPLEIAEEVKITPKTMRILRLKLCPADKDPQTETTSGGMNP